MARQGKSKNGCVTCRRKRLKCDETKPTCRRCATCRIPCEGYRKHDFKWRSLNHQIYESSHFQKQQDRNHKSSFNRRSGSSLARHNEEERPPRVSTPVRSAFATAAHAFEALESSEDSSKSALNYGNHDSPAQLETTGLGSSHSISESIRVRDTGQGEQWVRSLSGISATNPSLSEASDSESCFTSSLPAQNSQVLPQNEAGLDERQTDYIHNLPSNNFAFDHLNQLASTGDIGATLSMSNAFEPSNYEADTPDECVDLIVDKPSFDWDFFNNSLFMEPFIDVTSQEALMLRYNNDTCGILSLKDGPNENPWRTLIGPLSSTSLAVQHAISSMAASHGSYNTPSLRLRSLKGRNDSIKELVNELQTFRIVPALTTSLVLAFAEGWDDPISNFTHHLRGARGLLKSFFRSPESTLKLRDESENAKVLRYLCNTFVYLDVISRLTGLEEETDPTYEEIISAVNFPRGGLLEVDPLLGCASSLFPLMADVAAIVQKVRKNKSISLGTISAASDILDKMREWPVPNAATYKGFEDKSSHVRHAVQTADAIRYAGLLYLNQAVPDLLSESVESLTRKVLSKLATVPPSSRTLNTQIFPLLIASCEVKDSEDRIWIKKRWNDMTSRLRVKNVDCCWQIVQDVWARRDALKSSTEELCSNECFHSPEMKYKVGCKLHWLSAMLDRQWEVFPG